MTTKTKLHLALNCILCLAFLKMANADMLTTTAGTVRHGTIVQTNSDGFLILADYGTVKNDAKSDGTSWTRADLNYSRTKLPPVAPPAAATYAPASSEASHNYDHGSVYVHGYYRKNGTYVHSYTRRR